MGCCMTKKFVATHNALTVQNIRPTYIMLSSERHTMHLLEYGEIKENACEIVELELRELHERKYKEFADLLENPHLNFNPKEKYIAF